MIADSVPKKTAMPAFAQNAGGGLTEQCQIGILADQIWLLQGPGRKTLPPSLSPPTARIQATHWRAKRCSAYIAQVATGKKEEVAQRRAQ